ncbi:hypothetical protein Q7P37_003824 [Cladosporium fusiforme]
MEVGFNNTAPWSWPSSTFWDGNDGQWNSFIVQVGTPPQDFRILPSILEQATWVLHPQGCTPDDPADCPYSRGALPFQGANNTGLQVNESSTWATIGIYTLSTYGERMGYPGNGLFGFDNVGLSNESNSLELSEQVVAAIADKSFYLGQFGLGPKPSNFTTFNDPIPNTMANLVNESMIPSMSFGYTAGAYYRSRAPASLTLGGYDENRFEPSELSFNMHPDNSRPLQVGVQKLLGENTLDGSVNLQPTGTYHLVDSTVPHIWLPDEAIDRFVSAFGLNYDNQTDLFLVNDTIRNELLDLNPTITFVLGTNSKDGTGQTQNIELPYAAFDLQAGYPFYENRTVNYFPIRRAGNDTQYTIGRTFLQEAYVIVDWERRNFTLAQARFDSLGDEQLVPIFARSEADEKEDDDEVNVPAPEDDTLSAGAIAGIVIGVVAGLAIIGLGVFMCLRRRKQQSAAAMAVEKDEKGGYSSVNGMHKSPHHSESELESSNRNELPAGNAVSEADGVTKWGRFGLQEAPTAPIGGEWHRNRSELGHGDGFLAEAPGSERHRYELPGSEALR